MATKTGWKKASNDTPYVYGNVAYTVSRSGNKITYEFNQGYHITATKGYWNWPWRVSFTLSGASDGKDKTYNNKTVKPTTSGVIQNKDYWLSSQAGNFKGSITIKGTAKSITLKSKFSDTAKHTGPTLSYSIPIPTATAPTYTVSASDIQPTSANVTVTGIKAGSYATISKITLTYGDKTITGGTGSSYTFNLTGLSQGASTEYKVTVTNSAGLSTTKSGTITTGEASSSTSSTEKVIDPTTGEEEVIIVPGEIPNKVIYPDGTIKEFVCKIIPPSGGLKNLKTVVQI